MTKNPAVLDCLHAFTVHGDEGGEVVLFDDRKRRINVEMYVMAVNGELTAVGRVIRQALDEYIAKEGEQRRAMTEVLP